MKDFFRRNLLYIAVAAVILFGFSRKLIHTSAPLQTPLAKQNSTHSTVNTPKETSAQADITQAPPVSQPQPTPIVTQVERKKFQMQDPFCLGGKSRFIILPSIYLSEFYERKTSWIALPQSYAKCFTKDANADFYFFEFNQQHQLPVEPLVKMPGRITNVKTYSSYADFRKENLNAQYEIRNQSKSKKKKAQKFIFDAIENEFSSKLIEPWVQITISATNVEEKPSYWPTSPLIHPVAQTLSLRQFNEILKAKRTDITFLDVRSKKHRTSYPLPFKSAFLKNRSPGYNDHVISNLSKLSEAHLKEVDGELLQGTFILIGSDIYDYSPYNAANLLALKGVENIYILEGGASALGGPQRSLPALTGQGLSAEQLRNLIKKERSYLALVDCRPIKSVNGEIPGSIHPQTIGTAPKENTGGSEELDEKIDAKQLKEDLRIKRVQSVVLYGASRVDQKPIKVYNEIQTPEFKFYQLEDGIKAWSFYAKYKWPNEGDLVSVAKNTKRNHAPPARHRVNPHLKPGNVAGGNKGAAAGSLKGRRVTEAELNAIRNAKASRSANKKKKKEN